MSKTMIGVLQFLSKYAETEEMARETFEKHRLPDGVYCLRCHSDKVSNNPERKGKHCIDCFRCFTVKTGMIFEGSKIKLKKLFFCTYFFNASCKSISSLQLAKQPQVTQKKAWFMMYRLRHACVGRETTYAFKVC